MKWMSVSVNNGDKSTTQHLPQTEYVACPHATQYLCINQAVTGVTTFGVTRITKLSNNNSVNNKSNNNFGSKRLL
jgi:hypothetical protein